ncbi:mannosyl-oligosaccharide--1,2-mannosidase [Gracilaria domingensis]|nr:mannosyl-oligosaccharide--1,2-mannosidase [Gracilaria domingensis]
MRAVRRAPSQTVPLFVSLVCVSVCVSLIAVAHADICLQPCASHDTRRLTARVLADFDHAFLNYKRHALSHDELQPISCQGVDTFGALNVTLVDTLDTHFVLGNYHQFVWAAKHVTQNLHFDVDSTVSVFEITIRVLGGLLSAHGLLTEPVEQAAFVTHLLWPSYDDSLLYLAVQLADRLLPAFNTPTRIPYGSIHLQNGVRVNESQYASTAAAGSLLLEFGTLSRYTETPYYYDVAFASMHALHQRAAWTGLVGNHINIINGEWVATDSGVGGLIDSFYEYMLKGYVLFGDPRLLEMHNNSYNSVNKYVRKNHWFLNVDMWTGQTVSTSQSSLSAFYPGFQVLQGHIPHAIETVRAHYSVWRKYGCLPEGYDVQHNMVTGGQINYPLRPEMIESIFYLHWATKDPTWVALAATMLHSIEQKTRVKCGFAQVHDVTTGQLYDLMDSFLMSETFKYLYLIFRGDDHWLRSGRYVLTTEAHPLRIPLRKVNPNITASKPPAPRFKCPRMASAERLLPCGYGLQGTDYPVLSPSSTTTEEVSEDVRKQVLDLVEHYGVGGLQLGEVFIDERNAYRVMTLRGNQVVFAKLNEDERRREQVRLSNIGCSSMRGVDIVRHLCRWQDYSSTS